MRENLISYLQSTGWTPATESGSEGTLWRQADSPYAVPVPNRLEAESPEWELILDRLGFVEQSDPREVAKRVSGRLLDIAYLRAANDLVIEDTIPFAAGVSMVRDSWIMLRSCATTSLGFRAHIAGNYRRSGDDILEHARMAHTIRGSFIIPIYMPITAPEERQGLIEGLETAPAEPNERRVMRTFAESLSIFAKIIDAETEPTANDVQDMIRAGVSHEFSAGLNRILANESVAEFTAAFAWASGAGPVPSTPSRIEIPAAASKRVERVSQRLKTERPARGVEVLTGPIVGVQRDDADTGGFVTIQTVRSARPCHVSVNVSRAMLDQALDWMKQRATALVSGRVRRTGAGLFVDERDSIGLLAHGQLFGGRE
jgi:hypothetical protein